MLSRCKGVGFVCLEQDMVVAGEPTIISWPSAYLQTSSSKTVLIKLFKGDVFSVNTPCAPKHNGVDSHHLQQWRAADYKTEGEIAFESIVVDFDLIRSSIEEDPNSRFYFLVADESKVSCLVGPMQNTEWKLGKLFPFKLNKSREFKLESKFWFW